MAKTAFCIKVTLRFVTKKRFGKKLCFKPTKLINRLLCYQKALVQSNGEIVSAKNFCLLK